MKRKTGRRVVSHRSERAPARRLATSVLAALVPFIASAQTVVIGADNPAIDVPAVQAAVNAGGSVLLLKRFNFGDHGRVDITNDVDIGGEPDDDGAPPTIRGGEWTFHTPYPVDAQGNVALPPRSVGPRVSIHGLHFLDSLGTAIHLAYSGGCSLHHNVIEQMRRRPTTGGVSERAAIVVGPSILLGTFNGKGIINQFIPLLVSGDVVVSDNVLDVGGSEDTTKTRGTGMFVAQYVGADVRIERNVVLENTRTGLAILDGEFEDPVHHTGRGSVVIADNVVRSSVHLGFTQGAGPRAPIGIVTGFNNQRSLGSDPNRPTIPVRISGNTIELHGLTSMGIVNIWNGAVMRDNVITVHADPGGTTDRLSTSGGILATTSNQVLVHNRVAGEGCNAVRLGGTVDGQERFGDVAIANHVETFTPFVVAGVPCATYWLEPASHDNTVVGDTGTAIDDGTRNRVTGLRGVAGGVGGAVSATVATDPAAGDETFGFE